MGRSYLDVWAWYNAFGEQAEAAKDNERINLYRLSGNANQEADKYPEHTLSLYQQGQALAAQLKEPWIEMFYECWMVSTLLFKLARYEEGLDLATKLVVKSSQASYTDCPVRPWTFSLLISAYLNLDGLSYTDEVTAMLETLETRIALDLDTYRRLFVYRANVLLLLNDQDKTREITLHYVDECDQDSFRLTDGYEILCGLSYLRGDYQQAMEYSHLAEEHAGKSNRQDVVVNTHWWQAVLLFLRGEHAESERLFRLGLSEANALQRPKEIGFWGGVCRYYEVTGAYDKALLFWDEQVQLMDPATLYRGTYFTIFLRRCFVLRKMGRLTEADIEQTRQSALRMRKPERYLALMEELHDGNTEIPPH